MKRLLAVVHARRRDRVGAEWRDATRHQRGRAARPSRVLPRRPVVVGGELKLLDSGELRLTTDGVSLRVLNKGTRLTEASRCEASSGTLASSTQTTLA